MSTVDPLNSLLGSGDDIVARVGLPIGKKFQRVGTRAASPVVLGPRHA